MATKEMILKKKQSKEIQSGINPICNEPPPKWLIERDVSHLKNIRPVPDCGCEFDLNVTHEEYAKAGKQARPKQRK